MSVMAWEGMIDVRGGRLWVQEEGEGTAVVLLHAGICDARMWDDQWQDLALARRAVRLELRGFGRSDMPAGPFSHHTDVATVMRARGIARAHLIGLSMGGQVALDLALADPQLALSVTCAGTGPSGRGPTRDLREFWEELEAVYDRDGLDDAIEMEQRLWVDGPARSPDGPNPRVRERVRVMNRAIWARGEWVNGPNPLDPPAVDRLGELEVPLLAIAGALDHPYMLDGARMLAEGAPDGRLVRINSAAHVMNMERPGQFTRAVEAFMSSVEAR
jgi:3-oxoadipate enol-lactonase